MIKNITVVICDIFSASLFSVSLLKSSRKFLDRSFSKRSSVSKTMAKDLAKTLHKISGADWVMAETGMLGPPSKNRKSDKCGQFYIALSLKKNVQYKFFEFNPFLSRKEHQLLIAIEAFRWAKDVLQN